MITNDFLLQAREEARKKNLKREHRSLRKRRANLTETQMKIARDLGEDPAPSEIHLRGQRREGYFEAISTLFALSAALMLIEFTFRVFLPQDQFSIWWQRAVGSIFLLGTVLACHFGSSERERCFALSPLDTLALCGNPDQWSSPSGSDPRLGFR